MSRRLIALIRGINVGRAKRVPMADLRVLVGKLGFTRVRTVLNSGNLVFAAPKSTPAEAARRIEKAIDLELGVTARVIGLSTEELSSVLEGNPLQDIADNPSRLLVAVLADQADRARLEPLMEQDWAPERLALGARVAYLWCPGGVLKSRLWDAIARTLDNAVTSRNWSTMQKIHKLAQAEKKL